MQLLRENRETSFPLYLLPELCGTFINIYFSFPSWLLSLPFHHHTSWVRQAQSFHYLHRGFCFLLQRVGSLAFSVANVAIMVGDLFFQGQTKLRLILTFDEMNHVIYFTRALSRYVMAIYLTETWRKGQDKIITDVIINSRNRRLQFFQFFQLHFLRQ